MSLAFVDLLVDHLPEIPEVLNGGVDEVQHWIADAGEDLLATFVPAYGVARSQALLICAGLPGMDQTSCNNKVQEIKYTLFDEFARLTGLRSIISAIVDAWMMIPKAIREVAVLAGEALETASSVVNAAKDVATGLFSFDPEKTIAALTQSPGLLVKSGLNLMNSSLGAAAGMITMWGDFTDDIAGAVKVPVLREVLTGAIKLANIPLEFIGDVAKTAAWLASKAYAIGAIAVEEFGKAVKWLGDTFGDISAAVGEGLKDAGEAVIKALGGLGEAFLDGLGDIGGAIIDGIGDAVCAINPFCD